MKEQEIKDNNFSIEIHTKNIQDEAESVLGRLLSNKELDDVNEEICNHLSHLIMKSIQKVINFNNLIVRSLNVNEDEPHYELHYQNCYWKNGDYIKRKFVTEIDAKLYAKEALRGQGWSWILFSIDGTCITFTKAKFDKAWKPL